MSLPCWCAAPDGRHEPNCPITLGYTYCEDCGHRTCVCGAASLTGLTLAPDEWFGTDAAFGPVSVDTLTWTIHVPEALALTADAADDLTIQLGRAVAWTRRQKAQL